MDLFQKNKNYLPKMRRALFAPAGRNRVFEAEEDVKYEKKDGCYLAERRGVKCFVQSRYSIPREIESMFSSVPENAENIVLFGCGNGEAVAYALNPQKFPNLKNIIVIEPSLKWIELLMNETDLEEIWGQDAGKISLLVGYQSKLVGGFIAEESIHLEKGCCLVFHLSTRAIFNDYYQEMTASITTRARNDRVLMNTRKTSGHIRAYNEIMNLSCPTYNFMDFMSLFKERNIIIVAAGPSLEKNIYLLKDAKKKAVIIAVGSAISILNKRGIIPHFRIAIDPFPAETKIFTDLKGKQPPLIYSASLNAEILPDYKGAHILIGMPSDEYSRWLFKKKINEFISFPSGVSVGNVAASVSCISGCKRLVFIGLDMCMYNSYQIHADSGEELHYKKFERDETALLFLKDIFGNDVVSPRNYYMIKEAMENILRAFGEQVEIINATEGGLGLEGVPNKPLAEVLSEWEEDDPALAIKEAFKNASLLDFRDELRELKEQIAGIDRLNDERLEKLQEIKDAFLQDVQLSGRNRYIKAFTEAQKIEGELKKIELYSQCIHPDLETLFLSECIYWSNGIDSTDEKTKFRSILEVQLLTTQGIKSYTIILTQALNKIFPGESKPEQARPLSE